ncbi:spore germination protein [Paenibacillus oryzisoli]|uniref:spore germination protein n=1 Tax=Paenibacillus oryzisoli TaxID=1850517 RepID=UPI003D2E762F
MNFRFFSPKRSFNAMPSPHLTDPSQETYMSTSSISTKLEENRSEIETIFSECADFTVESWSYGPYMEYRAFSCYFTTLIQQKKFNFMKETLEDLVSNEGLASDSITPKDIITFFNNNGVSTQTAEIIDSFDDAVRRVLSGDIVIFIGDWDKALGYKAMGLSTRQITEPVTEPVVQGPRMSTIEDMNSNIGLIRNLMKSPKFKIVIVTVGQELRREISYGYLEGSVNPETLTEFQRRIADVEKEDIIDTSYLEEWIGENSITPFPAVRYTERPDAAVGALLDGKIIAMVNGSPSILICPVSFFEFFTTSEDYYHRSVFSSLIRSIRFIAFLIALLLPSTYIALSTFHSELIPTVLLLALLDTREGIPFPAFFEALLMEFFFELLREAGLRLPRPIGSAVSIVGALVIGQAAIQAKIASPVMVIIVSLTGIASFALPQYNMGIALRILRFPLMVLAFTLGGFGVMIGILWMLLHLTCLRSLGQPYLSPIAPMHFKQLRDIFIRVSRKKLLESPRNQHRHAVEKERK